jgi:hypothetical protein
MCIGGLERAEVVRLAYLNISDFFSSPREFKLTCDELMDADGWSALGAHGLTFEFAGPGVTSLVWGGGYSNLNVNLYETPPRYGPLRHSVGARADTFTFFFGFWPV